MSEQPNWPSAEGVAKVLNNSKYITFEDFTRGIHREALGILLTKRQARGTSNITKQGFSGVMQRLYHDKMARVMRVADMQQMEACANRLGVPMPEIGGIMADSTGETVRDDLLDIINYAIIGLALLEDSWE